MFTDSLSGVAPLATQRPICLILEMDGFSVGTILAREVGQCDLQGGRSSLQFEFMRVCLIKTRES